MAVIGKCQYNSNGKLVRPTERDIDSATGRMFVDMTGDGLDRLTIDPDHTHVFLLKTSGLSPQQANQRSKDKLQRFFERVDFLDGFRKINVERRTGYTSINQNYQVTYEILYAVESPSRARNTVSPFEGQKRTVDMHEFG